MASKIAYFFCIHLLVFFGGSSIYAQDFTVITEMRDLNAGKIMGRSRTIFHAGEAYDQVSGLGETTLFQPGREQITIFSESRMMATTISFGEIVAKQRDFNRQIESHITQLKLRGSAETKQKAAELAFQLRPAFQEHFDAKRNKLSMTSDYYSYIVETEPDLQPEIVAAYLRYADWTKQLNALLDPMSIFPAPRLIVNQALRNRGAMPLTVTLQHPGAHGLQYQSRHLIRWKLTESDNATMLGWSQLLEGKDMHWVSFDEFQAALRPAQGK